MKYLHMISWAVTALGVLVLVSAAIASMAPLWMLIGLLLVVTGVIKIVMIQIWTRIARLGTDEHDPINAL